MRIKYGEYVLTAQVRERMLGAIAARGERGIARAWLVNQFGGYRGWDDYLGELLASGRVRAVRVRNRHNNPNVPFCVVYRDATAEDAARQTCA